jgi:hypothetical protein
LNGQRGRRVGPDVDPVVGAVRRWVNAIDPEDRHSVLATLLGQIDGTIADELRPQFDVDGEG